MRTRKAMTNKEPLDKKISEGMALDGDFIYVKDVKSSLSNLKKRLKEELPNNCNDCYDWNLRFIDKLFSEEIGSGLLEGENGPI